VSVFRQAKILCYNGYISYWQSVYMNSGIKNLKNVKIDTNQFFQPTVKKTHRMQHEANLKGNCFNTRNPFKRKL
jgi:hypothetical protein